MTERFRARWVFPVDAPSLQNGIVEVDDGRITAVHDRPDPEARDLGNVALIPGLVNAHTHLEFADLAEPIRPATPFTSWIRALVAARRGRSEPIGTAISQGLRESHAAGVTTVGEIATAAWSADLNTANAPRTVVFRELLGLQPARGAEQLNIARSHLAAANETDSAVCRLIRGLSPHAPYSVHPELYRGLVALAREYRAPVAVHLAEATAELELLDRGTGEFVDLLRGFGAWEPDAIPHGSRPLDYLVPLAELEHALVIHGNYLAPAEIDFLAAHQQIAVVYCPRTHAYFGHSPHPWRRLLDRGIRVALGTDSRGSNPDLNLWREVQFLHAQHPEVHPATLLGLATLAGASALGLEHETGSLTPGKLADLAIVRLPDYAQGSPYELLLAGISEVF